VSEQIALEAAAADQADRRVVGQQEHPRSHPAVGRALAVDDAREHRHLVLGERCRCCQDVSKLAHWISLEARP